MRRRASMPTARPPSTPPSRHVASMSVHRHQTATWSAAELDAAANRRGISPLRRAEDAGPLPRELPPEQATQFAEDMEQARKRMRTEGEEGNNSESTYSSAWRKWWKGFCKYAQWDHELMMVWLDPVTGAFEP